MGQIKKDEMSQHNQSPEAGVAAENVTPPPPQSFPPPQGLHPDYDKPRPEPFPQVHDVPDTPRPLPLMGQLFPPQQQTGQHFPMNVTSGNQYIHPQPLQQQQNHLQGKPVRVQQSQLPTQPWKAHIFGCMENPQNAIITLFFPCVTFGQIAETLDSGSTSCGTSGMWYSLIACCIGMPCIMSCTYRSKLRSKFGLVESAAPDWVIHCFCEHCALCQEYRELQERGYDPSIGWFGNVAKLQQQQFGMTPPTQQRMFS